MRTAAADTLSKIDSLSLSLCREFPALGGRHVRELMDRDVDELLGRAHFADFVPLLAYRHVRDGIRDVAGIPAGPPPQHRASRG
jgi:hypothetical protein